MQHSIVIAEDDEHMAYGLDLNLRCEGYRTQRCRTGADVMESLRSDSPDLVLLDLTLPDIDGIEVLRQLRQDGHRFPVVVLSGRNGELDKVAAFRTGADDYIVKPFFLLELLERIRIRLQPTDLAATSPRNPRLVIDTQRRVVLIDDREVSFTPREAKVLAFLVSSKGHAISRAELYEGVWGAPAQFDTGTVKTHIARIRTKLREFNLHMCLNTVHGIGFRWRSPELASVVMSTPDG